MTSNEPPLPSPTSKHAVGQSSQSSTQQERGIFARWSAIPLYLRILGGSVLGVVVGLLLGPRAASLGIPSKLILQLLTVLASPLIFVAVVQALMRAELPKGTGLKLVSLLLLNTLVAICIGLIVANTLQPGRWTKAQPPPAKEKAEETENKDPVLLLLDNVPKSIFGPLTDDGKVLSVIVLAVAFGIAMRRLKDRPIANDLVNLAFDALLILLHWIVELIPFGVFGIVASIIGTKGFHDFVAIGGFVLAVLTALGLQVIYYLLRIRFASWVRPIDMLRSMRDALVMAFSTGSSTATMPLTYSLLREKVGLRERSASLGALVGANFNNDGTALYEAMSALFVAQMLGMNLDLKHQVIVVLTSVVASVGAAGIPEAGLVTMTLVFTAVGLPTDYIAVLLTVDWFLDRCRTAINVLGDVNVSCILGGKTREVETALAQSPIRNSEP